MDTRDINTQNLLFLLTAAPLGVGCVITDGDDETTTTTATTSATATTTATGTGTSPTSDGSGDGSSGGDTTTTTDPTVADTGTSTTDPGTTTEGGVVECTNYGDNIEYCYDADAGTAAEEYCLEVLEAYYVDYGADCAAAGLTFFACLSNLSCDDLALPVDEVCVPEQEALDAACGGG